MKKILVVALFALALLACSAGLMGLYLYRTFTSQPASNAKQAVIYEVKPGMNFLKIAKDLETAGIVKNASLFNLYAKWINQRNKVKAGEYEFQTSMIPKEVMDVLVSGKSIAHPLTISEGLNIYEIAQIIESRGLGTKESFFSLVRDPEIIQSLLGAEAKSLHIGSLEGYLYPETYMLTKYMTMRDLVLQMVRRSLSVWAEIQIKYPQPRMKMTRHERMTLASIIEKETGNPKERTLISSIFHNRIDKGMKLQTDPTILYGLSEAKGKQVLSILKVDILRPTPYNTYVIYGLPKGPIANPGYASIEASFNPEDTEYLFFVSRNDGTSVFSETYEEHSEAVRKYQLDPKARQGKSWRDLSKTNK